LANFNVYNIMVYEMAKDSGVCLGKVKLLPNMRRGMGLIGLNTRSNSGLGKTFNNSSLMIAATLSFPSTRHGESKGNGDDMKNRSRMMASRAIRHREGEKKKRNHA
jgi:hypothetical protein